MSGAGTAKVEVVPQIADIPAEAWDACANPDPATFNPFLAHAFLKALEDAGTVGGRTGWTPRHLVLKLGGEIAGCAPCYLKAHSQGEYVFDHSWAEAFMQAGGRLLSQAANRRALHARAGPAIAGAPRT